MSLQSPPHVELNSEPTVWKRRSLGQRATSFFIALIIEILIILGLLTLGTQPFSRQKANAPFLTFQLKSPAAAASHRPKASTQEVASIKHPPKVPPPHPIHVLKPVTDEKFVEMSKDDFAASDISKLSSHKGAGSGTGSAKAYGPGEGPDGQPLYNAEWYKEPTDGELDFYLNHNRPAGGWAIIACHTIENYHVDNCQSLGESPIGSGLAKALRQAAWQFRIRPPRIGDKPMVGAWVRIRFDFTRGEVK